MALTAVCPAWGQPFTPIDISQFYNGGNPGRTSAPYPAGSVTLANVPFALGTQSSYAWYSSGTSRVLELPVSVQSPTTVHLLMNTLWGVSSPRTSVEFFGTNGAYFRFDPVGNRDIRDFNQAGFTNSINGTTSVNVWQSGSGQRIDKQRVVLPSSFLLDTLNRVRITDSPASGVHTLFVVGLTVETCAGCGVGTRTVSSNDAITAREIPGTLSQQLAVVNAAPVGSIAEMVERQQDRHSPSSFNCGDLGTPSTLTLSWGDRDDFHAGDPSDMCRPSDALLASARAYFPGLTILGEYDVIPGTPGRAQNQIFVETLRGIPGDASAAKLRMRLRAGSGGAETDEVRLGFTGGSAPGARWAQFIPGWMDNHGAQTFEFDLSSLPRPGTTPLNLLPYIASRGGSLNVVVSDDTGVDWMEVETSTPGGPIDPLSKPFVRCDSYLDRVDEISRDNCSSAWYQAMFTLPARFEGPYLSGVANADRVAVAYLNGNRISPTILATDLNTGGDRTDVGQPLLNSPTRDTFSTSVSSYFRPGPNLLVFGVLKGSSSPTGIEFDATVTYRELCVADLDDGSGRGWPDRGVTIDDLLYYLTAFSGGNQIADVDDGSGTGTLDGGVTIDDLLYYLQRFEAGC